MATDWVALLRGVNVNGITIRSAELRELFEGLGFAAVKTVLASGNVRFAADDARDALKARVERALRDRFGYDAWIILVTLDELHAAIRAFPFDAEDAGRQPYVVFCSESAVRDELLTVAASLDPPLDPRLDPVAEGPGVVYWSPAKGSSTDTPFAKVLARARYKSTTTTRNLRTLTKIVA
jgi:uncharacterized protein (DUF1697 family)